MNAEVSVVVDPLGWRWDGLQNPKWHLTRMSNVSSSAANQLWQNCEPRPLSQIVVYPRREGPICDFKRDSKGRVRVGLNTKPNAYAQQAYQFAHEFCHIIANHTRDGQAQNAKHVNHWIEECFCETASLFALRRMATDWQQRKEFAAWTTGDGNPFYPEYHKYAQERIGTAISKSPADQKFHVWFESRQQFLRDHPVAFETDKRVEEALRTDYTFIAIRLLPLLESAPANWDSITYLNLTPHRDVKPLAEHFLNWKTASPERYHPFIASVEAQLNS